MNSRTTFTYENSIGTITFEEKARQFWITEIDGVSSVEIDVSESRSSGQVGSFIAGQSVQPRTFTIDGTIYEPLELNRKRLLDVLAPQIPATLTYRQDGESWYLDVVPKKTPEITPGTGMQFFQTTLYAAYPYWRTTDSYAKQIVGLLALFKFPFYTGGAWWISQFGGSYFNTIENTGNVPIDFRVVFTARGTVLNPELYHMDTGQKILIEKEMVAKEKVIVSTIYGQKGVTCISPSGEVTNGFRYLSIDSDLHMALNPGSNLLRVDATENREGLNVRVEAPQGVRSGV